MRLFTFALSVAVFSCLFFYADDGWAKLSHISYKNPKYAALVMDVDTGEVLFARSADKIRHPASLTKMMTLYLLFEALEEGEVKLYGRMKASDYAASQPQTNIGLKKGDTIAVHDAIKAMVVRSANDVAVVIAEHLAGTEKKFANQMNAKAAELGMHSTKFTNPHGLPDRKQVTTARDMAKLGIALRRNFKDYYHYFKTTKFTWRGKEYKSHNKVLTDYDGVDGIKTGYIRMSGFNLVTSAMRNDYHLMAVVMGGKSARQRDGHMEAVLSKTFTRLAERGDRVRLYAHNAPKPKLKPTFEISVRDKEVETAALSAKEAFSFGGKKEEGSIFEVVGKGTVTAAKLPATLPEKHTLGYQLYKLNISEEKPSGWGIQVGAFTEEKKALVAASNAVEIANRYLKDAMVSVTDKDSPTRTIHRARFANLTEYQAKQACETLISNNAPCFVFKASDQRNL